MIDVILIIGISFVIHIGFYFYAVKKEKNYINVFFPFMLSVIPVNFIFEPLWLYYYGTAGTTYAYFYVYFCSNVTISTMVWAYIKFPKGIIIDLPFSRVLPKARLLSYFLIIVASLVYLPVLLEFKEFIFEPREIYTRTRTGYGLYFFVSSFLAMIGFVLLLFSKNLTRSNIIIVTIFEAVFLFLHGSKGQVLILLLILAIFFTYVKDWKVNVKKMVVMLVSAGGLVVTLFILTTSYEYDNIFKVMLGYSDYNRNAMIVVDRDDSNYHGQITYESNFYSRIPRALMPDKPKDYGVFKLAKKYFPEWYYADTGSPAFGYGIQYADFGIFALFYLAFWGCLTGALLKIFINRLQKFKTPGDFIVVLFLCGIVLIPLGDGYLLPEHLLTALIINMLLSLKFK
ncbi:hypothetical protein EZ449_19390 [Pedobacter frigidisoli]|uniref:Oligosaccharide repeat unit polymerase n=1 Tax=Pedobacter frigidisoli TaxID=2530455 RepID=A0A4R0NQ92_9SPHI|nr:hypothetical protein [Pedobacter frigidisoli]TCD01963.1 hypothetical protein EZ449_19390 [Pedobacter frigidisoli]